MRCCKSTYSAPTERASQEEANALNRPVTYTRENEDGTRTVITNHRFLYRGHLQIAALDLTRATLNDLWLVTWDPAEPVATRPLAIQKDGTWYTYGLDLPKNITEIYGTNGGIKTAYTYTPYGQVTANGSVTQSPRGLGGGLDKPEGFAPQGRAADGAAVSQPIQWSSEYADTDLALVYYNYRHYNPLDGRWTGRDIMIMKKTEIEYGYIQNTPVSDIDYLGLIFGWLFGQNQQSPSPQPSNSQPEQQNKDNRGDDGLEEPKEQEKTECQQYVDRAMEIQKIKDIKKLLSENSCAIPRIECKCCKNKYAGVGALHFPPGKNDPGRIVMCTNGKKSEKKITDRIGHELIHRLQNCQGRTGTECLETLKNEVEAYKTHIKGCSSIVAAAKVSVLLGKLCSKKDLSDEVMKKATEYCNSLA